MGPDFFSHFGRRLLELADIAVGARVLDVAAGTGAITLPAARHVGPAGMVFAVDLSPRMVNRLQAELARWAIKNAAVALMDAERLGLRTGIFDAVLCGFALDSFPNPNTALDEMRRTLRVGGLVGITVADRWWWEGDERWRWHHELLQSLRERVRSQPARFARPQDVREAYETGGFREIRVQDEAFPLAFTDATEWWRWAWSHGYRAVLESMGATTLERYRATCFKQLGSAAKKGRIEGRLEVIVGLARKEA